MVFTFESCVFIHRHVCYRAFIFLTEMFLLVGGPIFVFSGKAYADSTMSCAGTVCDMQYMKIYSLLWFCWRFFPGDGEVIKTIILDHP